MRNISLMNAVKRFLLAFAKHLSHDLHRRLSKPRLKMSFHTYLKEYLEIIDKKRKIFHSVV